MTVASVMGKAIQVATGPAFRRFLRAMEEPEATQKHVLGRIVRHAALSAYGRHHGLAAADGWKAFQEKIPIAGYETFRPWIERAVFDQEPGILSPHPIKRVEATSGSSSSVKWIPYTGPMLRTFSRMFSLWAHDVLRHGLYRPKTGKLFLCVTGGCPEVERCSALQGGDDREYLGPMWRLVLDRFVVAPEFACSENPLENLAQAMAGERRIELMSFWSPSLLLSVLDYMGVSTPEETRRAWPNLQLISCWTAASSSLFADRLRELFPHIVIQGKGLLATEAAVTMPSEGAGGCVPLLHDVYLEFLEEEGGEIRLLHELKEGREYEVILSNEMGLLRYRLGDRVRVSGYYRRTPLLEFLGRAGIVSDLVGEKLTLPFIEKELGSLIKGYFCLVPLDRGYELWIEGRHGSIASADLETVLCRNFQYHRALRLGQLRPLEVKQANDLAGRIQHCLEKENGRAAVFKPSVLIHNRSLAKIVSRELRRTPRANME